MSWATVIGLSILLALTVVSARMWEARCKRKRRAELEAAIGETDHALAQAIENEPTNLAEHLRLRGELERLRKLRDAL